MCCDFSNFNLEAYIKGNERGKGKGNFLSFFLLGCCNFDIVLALLLVVDVSLTTIKHLLFAYLNV